MPGTDDYIGVVIADVARLLRNEIDRRVRDLGITRTKWLVLTRLHHRPGTLQSELADMMGMDKAAAARMIERLEADGWVKLRSEAADRRVKRIYLTAEAERLHNRIWRVSETTVEDALADLSLRESRQLMSLLLRVKTSLVAGSDAPPLRRAAAARQAPRRARVQGDRLAG